MSDHLGNTMALEGCDRCFCGCKYWENDRCVDCGLHISTIREQDHRGVHFVYPGHDVPPGFITPTTCGTCGITWDDAVVTGVTPAPSGRCPFEYDHEEEEPVSFDTGYIGAHRGGFDANEDCSVQVDMRQRADFGQPWPPATGTQSCWPLLTTSTASWSGRL